MGQRLGGACEAACCAMRVWRVAEGCGAVRLAQDNERLKEELSLETRQAKTTTNASTSAQIAKLQDQVDHPQC